MRRLLVSRWKMSLPWWEYVPAERLPQPSVLRVSSVELRLCFGKQIWPSCGLEMPSWLKQKPSGCRLDYRLMNRLNSETRPRRGLGRNMRRRP